MYQYYSNAGRQSQIGKKSEVIERTFCRVGLHGQKMMLRFSPKTRPLLNWNVTVCSKTQMYPTYWSDLNNQLLELFHVSDLIHIPHLSVRSIYAIYRYVSVLRETKNQNLKLHQSEIMSEDVEVHSIARGASRSITQSWNLQQIQQLLHTNITM